MKSNKHILLLSPGFAADLSDDSCIPALQVFLKRFLSDHPEYKISLIAFHYPYSELPYDWNGITVYPCNGRNRKWLKRLKTIRLAKDYFESIHRNMEVHLIHSFWLGECAQIGEELATTFKIPHINTMMGQDVISSNRFLNRSSLVSLDEIALCERHAAEFQKNSNRLPFATIPWGIDNENMESSETRIIDLLAAGNLIELKRYDLLIKAAAEIIKDHPSLRITIAGDGPDREKLELLADSFGIGTNINFVGQISREKVIRLMKQSKIFVHPSSFESYGFVFAEARKCGLKVISFPVGIAKESESWKIVNSLKEMVFAINEILSQPQTYKLEIDHAVENTVSLYNDIYSQKIELAKK